MMVGGGVHGKGVGINRGIMIQAGSAVKQFRLFINKFLQAGGMITRSTIGKGINGTTSGYRINKFNKTGTAGKRINIGRHSNIGVSRACIPEHGRNKIRRQIRKTRRASHSSHINNRESIKKGNKKTG